MNTESSGSAHPINCRCAFRPQLRGDEDENRQWVLRVSDALGLLVTEPTGYRTPTADDTVDEAYRLRRELHACHVTIAGLYSQIGQLELAINDPGVAMPCACGPGEGCTSCP